MNGFVIPSNSTGRMNPWGGGGLNIRKCTICHQKDHTFERALAHTPALFFNLSPKDPGFFTRWPLISGICHPKNDIWATFGAHITHLHNCGLLMEPKCVIVIAALLYCTESWHLSCKPPQNDRARLHPLFPNFVGKTCVNSNFNKLLKCICVSSFDFGVKTVNF